MGKGAPEIAELNSSIFIKTELPNMGRENIDKNAKYGRRLFRSEQEPVRS